MNNRIKTSLASCDWLTVTLREPHTPFDTMYWSKALHTLQGLTVSGNDTRPWAWKGYNGFRQGELQWGVRPDGSILRASGVLGHAALYALERSACNASRIDLAITYWFDYDQSEFASVRLERAAKSREGLPEGRRRKLTFVDGCGDGDTLYIGSRSSEQYGRIYDKWRESGNDDYKFAWRAEVEYKGEHARSIFRQLQGEKRREPRIAATVLEWFKSRGAELPSVDSARDPLAVALRKRTDDDSRKFAWLSEQVGPCATRLASIYGRQAVMACIFPEEEV